MTIITINLDDGHIEQAEKIARVLRAQSGENVSRSEVFRMAIEQMFRAFCPPDTTTERPEKQDIAA